MSQPWTRSRCTERNGIKNKISITVGPETQKKYTTWGRTEVLLPFENVWFYSAVIGVKGRQDVLVYTGMYVVYLLWTNSVLSYKGSGTEDVNGMLGEDVFLFVFHFCVPVCPYCTTHDAHYISSAEINELKCFYAIPSLSNVPLCVC